MESSSTRNVEANTRPTACNGAPTHKPFALTPGVLAPLILMPESLLFWRPQDPLSLDNNSVS